MAGSQRDVVSDGSSKSSSIPLVAIKILELLLLILCIGLIDDPANNSGFRTFVTQRTVGLSYATFGAFLIFTLAFLVMVFADDVCPWKTSALMSFFAAVLFLACASLLLRDWASVKERSVWLPNTQRLDLLCGAGAVSVILAVVFLVDLALTLMLGLGGSLD